nr:phage/plasmid-like protein TIGR03299 (TIGR03299) [uncultured Mediterranean phage uvMED]BAR27131.1 phage/plasmid-like protein TIGR03299 (TIGR03299) [uncultured Mediterranean phage uvMED]BAR27142.1 phage/plasmid-like protein TIGR03299 (TIGR03299) [uncultured Mediterranean phage uvMED]BAR39337.1 phage/plasmid-like protein TIGR03299 (TIGR03299) [uncultured Mediterranean phage uvMED]
MQYLLLNTYYCSNIEEILYSINFQLHPKIKMNNFQIFKNQLENTITMDSDQFSKNLNNQLNAEKLGYQNSSNETIFKGSNFIDDSFKSDLNKIWIDNGLDFDAEKTSLFYKGINGEMIEVKDHQAIINNKNNNLLNIPKMQYTTLQLSTIKNLIENIRGNTTIESIMNVDDKRFVFNLAVDNAIQDVKQDDPHKLRLVIVSSHDSSVSCHISFIHFRMFCFNQMNKLKQSNPLVFKHTKSINDNVKNINRIIDFNKGQFTQSIEDYKLMIKKEITDNQVKEVLEKLYFDKWNNKKVCIDRTLKTEREKSYKDLVEVKQIEENLLKEFETNGRNAYSLHNGINYYYSHQMGASNIKDESEKARIRMEQNYYGKNSAIIDRSKELCMSL